MLGKTPRNNYRIPAPGRPHKTEHCMASQLVRSVARATLSRGNVVRALSTTNALSAKDNVMEKWPAERFDKHFIDYLSRPEIDGWEVRKALTELHDYDVIPDPKVVEAALRACRRVNDLALCVRFLEAIKIKCGSKKNREVVYGYIINEVKPVLTELGIPTPEELGYDKPEFFIPQPDYWWEKKWYAEYGYDKKPAFQF
ncbi:cytochrome c oxidase subunit Va [Teladorsagia circumcincta]|uniref:Cytochrome c oxidase subunit 5A, mitochondrial n=1 Tax=Teladorsagia circumcincta TaxID=45464 RepID=A0A2G9UIC7_TELCI|nr:cytochrome c oxidase subunit Va [Teladorsagia circumcincta]